MVGVRLVAGVALAAALVACNGASDAAPEPSPSPAVVAASPSPAPTPEPSPSPTEALPANDVADPVAALEAIVRFRDELFEDPDPDKLALIYAERCPCYEEIEPLLREAAELGHRSSCSNDRADSRSSRWSKQNGPSAQSGTGSDSPAGSVTSRGKVVTEVRGTANWWRQRHSSSRRGVAGVSSLSRSVSWLRVSLVAQLTAGSAER